MFNVIKENLKLAILAVLLSVALLVTITMAFLTMPEAKAMHVPRSTQAHSCPAKTIPFEPWRAQMFAENPTALQWELEGKDRKVLIKGFNAVPPVSSYTPERVFIMARPGAKAALVIFLTGRCVTLINPIYWGEIESWGVDVKGLKR